MRYPVLEAHQRKCTMRFMVVDQFHWKVFVQDRRRRHRRAELLRHGTGDVPTQLRIAKRMKCGAIFRVKTVNRRRR